MEGLIDGLSKLAQARAGHIVSHATPMDVLAFAKHTVDLLDPVVRARFVRLDRRTLRSPRVCGSGAGPSDGVEPGFERDLSRAAGRSLDR